MKKKMILFFLAAAAIAALFAGCGNTVLVTPKEIAEDLAAWSFQDLLPLSSQTIESVKVEDTQRNEAEQKVTVNAVVNLKAGDVQAKIPYELVYRYAKKGERELISATPLSGGTVDPVAEERAQSDALEGDPDWSLQLVTQPEVELLEGTSSGDCSQYTQKVRLTGQSETADCSAVYQL